MFQESLVESTPLLRSRNRWPALISFTAQAILAAVLIAIPILHPEVLPTGPIKLSHLNPPLLTHPAPPPPPTQPVRVPLATSSPAPAAPSQAPVLSHPAPFSGAAPVAAPMLPLGDPNGTPSTSLSALNSVGPSSPHVVAAPAVGNSTRPLPVSTGVLAGNLLAPIQPAYPQMARLTGTQGTVVIQAIISRFGRIESARVISGPPMLQEAALQAVRAARYRPFLLNGQPTEVETTISINFRLGT
jgi:protein TonB